MPAITAALSPAGAPPSHTLAAGTQGLPSNVFHNLGQYSPWFPASSLDSEAELPDHCTVTFVSQLERHGSRYPTGGAYRELRKTLRRIAKHLEWVPDHNSKVTIEEALDPSLRWLRHWTETKKTEDGGLRNRLGNSELTPYGQYEAFASGRRFSERYSHLFESGTVDVNRDYAESTGTSKRQSPLAALERSICSDHAAQAADFASAASPLWLWTVVRKHLCHLVEERRSEPEPRGSLLERPFVRASGADRVIATSRFWLQGFATPRHEFQHSSPESAPWPPKGRPSVIDTFKGRKPQRPIVGLPEPDVIISEARSADKMGQTASNNTLDVYTCLAFEKNVRDNAQSEASRRVSSFAKNATREIEKRLAGQLGARSGGNKDRRGERLHFSPKEIQQLFSLCAFDTAARLDPYGFALDDPERNRDVASPFCSLFEADEFANVYEITTDIEKDYGFGSHQALHRALATPWLRELLARLEGREPMLTPPTSINTTLDSSSETFPLPSQRGPRAFADFTHDNQLAPIIAALNLWDEEHAWRTSETTPFSGRMTIEKVDCGSSQEYIRVLVNDAPASLTEGKWCPASNTTDAARTHDHLCPVSSFLSQLSWVDEPAEWNRCYEKKGR
ncbi:phosphoglycerate mutase-like protein [Testicularia cyperi]|uniref:Phosphoglycerate mutase-like protein n=1 Tax=Testicularia cyperi TaxID=1882483 RepID=A0A317XP50_9BASI|nr:phosphoglycerate mutase-like protein [Testicularia cyperi]